MTAPKTEQRLSRLERAYPAAFTHEQIIAALVADGWEASWVEEGLAAGPRDGSVLEAAKAVADEFGVTVGQVLAEAQEIHQTVAAYVRQLA